ncbi:ABC transporter ATP-binding protein [Lamprobacter modestohalophilus]|uniref:ABC transporter ATP-binding protein n=1 Tax=Lamprobacter modestohalophilus TaxID=1064514 RepID=UPI002ADEA5E5|nr:ABC transporter ATP-binding protein [Lamprobacter modestohalophilus]MEA1052535.1 ABC transporter ATP-binding protein [Lamprobacter modestohalophilus]
MTRTIHESPDNSIHVQSDTVVSLQNIGVAFNRQRRLFAKPHLLWVLKDVSFDLYRGETLGVIGRNAAGKSTLLRLLAGIIKQDRGQLINGGYSAALLSLQAGFVPYLTGRQNAILSGILLGLRRREVEERMPRIIAFSELGDFFDEPLGTYSTGMRARLGFSVAFQVDPDLLLIDETLGVGDEAFNRKSTRAMHDRIRSDRTVVLVSHSAGTIRSLCDRAIWIDQGVVRMQGDAREVSDAYHTEVNSNGSVRAAVRSEEIGIHR